MIDQRNCFDKKQCRIHRYLQVGLYCASESITCIKMSTTCFAIDYNVFCATIDNWQANTPYIFCGHLFSRYSRVLPRFETLASMVVLKRPSSMFSVCDRQWHFWKTSYEAKPTRFVLFGNDEDYFFPSHSMIRKIVLVSIQYISLQHFV